MVERCRRVEMESLLPVESSRSQAKRQLLESSRRAAKARRGADELAETSSE
jgi:hypothetical protein